MASQITRVSIVYSTVCSGADQRKLQSSASLAFVGGIHRWPVNSPHKRPVMRKKWFHLMMPSWNLRYLHEKKCNPFLSWRSSRQWCRKADGTVRRYEDIRSRKPCGFVSNWKHWSMLTTQLFTKRYEVNNNLSCVPLVSMGKSTSKSISFKTL